MSRAIHPFSSRSIIEWTAQFEQSASPDDRLQALQAIGSLCPASELATWAERGLSDPDATVRALAAKICGSTELQLTAKSEDCLTALLNDPDPDARFEAARALIRRKSQHAEQSADVLLAFVDEPETHPLMLATVLNCLVEFDGSLDFAQSKLQPRLQSLLDHERAEVREAVACAFAKWPALSTSCHDRLLPLLDDREPIVREKIAYTLGEAGIVSPAVLEALQASSEDEDSEVARIAAEALRKLTSSRT